MKFLINVLILTIKPLPQGTSWQQLPEVRSNGQHSQLKGFILAEYRPSSNELILLHPETESSTGHQDVKYYPNRMDREYGVSIQKYQQWQEIDFSNDDEVAHCWPDGGAHLLKTIIVAEEYLRETIDYVPVLMDYIVHTFRQTPMRPIPSGMV